mmetsp:Transcript_30230/g.5462  ORF Transcript_30230/g.5462 Transcript_30230/m.5462 type:complete len:91 (+) Transcript_30230:171-443(+)
MYEKGQEKQAAEFLKQAWLNMTGFGEVVELWNYNPVSWLFEKTSLLSTQPLRKFLETLVTKDIKRNVAVSAGNYNTGDLDTFIGRNMTRS